MNEHVHHIPRIGRRATPILALLLLPGCVLWARDPDFYEEELSELLEDHSEPIVACYDLWLEQHDGQPAAGDLTLAFEVEAKTGELGSFAIVEDGTTVPAELATCVTDELDGVKLEPSDVNTAEASFTWEFTLGSRKEPPADPFAGAQAAVLDCYRAHLAEVDREATGALVVDYAFEAEGGTVSRLEVVADQTSAPAPVVACVEQALAAATVDPQLLERRNLEGRRTFTLRYTPWSEGA